MASALSNRQNSACARKTLQTQRGRTHGAGCVRQWFRTAEPLGERRYENWNTHTHTHRLRFIRADSLAEWIGYWPSMQEVEGWTPTGGT